MLDFDALLGRMHELAGELADSARVTQQLREQAGDQLERARAMPNLREAILDFGQQMALPADGRDMGRVYPRPPAGDYTVMATDGSQVAPDLHHVAPWYVVNTGFVVFRYPSPDGRPRCVLDSEPRLFPPRRGTPTAAEEEADRAPADAVAASAGTSRGLMLRRLMAELEGAQKLLDQEADWGQSVLLLDGPLCQWRMMTDLRGPEREAVVGTFRNLVETARRLRVPVAGYISRSWAVEWVTLLRFSMCPDVAARGRLCEACNRSLLRGSQNQTPPPGAHHAALADLRDVEIADLVLPEPGMRTEVLELQSDTWKEVAQSAADELGSLGFCYLRPCASEIARLELPQWVWEDEDLMERLHMAVWDQCETGHGYPMVLSEAHEAAVVRGPDRDAFYRLVERILEEQGIYTAAPSAKATSKRRPLA